ncbi:MAG: DUF1223 domain-containing protein [Gammaproteobacteria bacterium]
MMKNRLFCGYTVKLFIFLNLFPAMFIPGWAGAAEVFRSGEQRVHVLELYTSEGCSSCPPADQWLSGLKQDERLWRELVPVAFHVDYWNYSGWQDRFSSPSYSERQRQYARAKGLATVYTPGFLLNGREWRSFFGLRELSLHPVAGAGSLTVNLDQQTIQAIFHPGKPGITRPVLNVAVLGFDLVSRVEAGENRGKQLQHDFTVLGYKTVPMAAAEDGYISNVDLPRVSVHAPRNGLAVWINDAGNLIPLQATGGWIK